MLAGERRISTQSFAHQANDKVLDLIGLLDKTAVIHRARLGIERDSVDLFFENIEIHRVKFKMIDDLAPIQTKAA